MIKPTMCTKTQMIKIHSNGRHITNTHTAQLVTSACVFLIVTGVAIDVKPDAAAE